MEKEGVHLQQASTTVLLQSAAAFFIILNGGIKKMNVCLELRQGVIMSSPVCVHKLHYFLLMMDSVYINAIMHHCFLGLVEGKLSHTLLHFSRIPMIFGFGTILLKSLWSVITR